MLKASEPHVTAFEVPSFISFADLRFLESRPSAFVTNTVCFNCFLCLSQLSAPNGVRVGRGGALRGFVSLHLLKHSQAGGTSPHMASGKPVALTEVRCVPAPPQKSFTPFRITLLTVGKRQTSGDNALTAVPDPRASNCFSSCAKFVYDINQHQATGKNVKIDCFTLF